MALDSRVDGAAAHLKVSGDIDFSNSDVLKSAAVRLLEGEVTVLVIDLAELQFMDSSGLGALIAIRNHATQSGRTLQIDNLTGQTRRLFEISGLLDWLVLDHPVFDRDAVLDSDAAAFPVPVPAGDVTVATRAEPGSTRRHDTDDTRRRDNGPARPVDRGRLGHDAARGSGGDRLPRAGCRHPAHATRSSTRGADQYRL